jgi:hypothetical protein
MPKYGLKQKQRILNRARTTKNDVLKRRKEEKSERSKKHKEYMQRRKEKQEQGITSDIKSNQMSLFDMEDEA